MGFLVFLVLIIVGFFLLRKKFYNFKKESAVLFVGGLGAGKSIISAWRVVSTVVSNTLSYHLRRIFFVIFRREIPPKPILFSTVPIKSFWIRFLKIEVCQITKNIIECYQQIPPGSCCFFDECSLFINQFMLKWVGKDKVEEFFTLYRQFTKGGMIVLNTQSEHKCNHVIRYCVNSACRLEKIFTFKFPFLGLLYIGRAYNVDLVTFSPEQSVNQDGYMMREVPRILIKFFWRKPPVNTHAYYKYYLSIATQPLEKIPFVDDQIDHIVKYTPDEAQKTSKKR